jgi:hypothetical protein
MAIKDELPDGAVAVEPPVTEDTKPLQDGLFYCDICEFSSKSERGVKRHKTVTHGADRSSPTSPKSSRGVKFDESVVSLYQTLGIGLALVSPTDGNIWCAHSEQMAASMVQLANDYPAVKKALQTILKGSVIGAVIMAHAPVIYLIAANHVKGLPVLPMPDVA